MIGKVWPRMLRVDITTIQRFVLGIRHPYPHIHTENISYWNVIPVEHGTSFTQQISHPVTNRTLVTAHGQ